MLFILLIKALTILKKNFKKFLNFKQFIEIAYLYFFYTIRSCIPAKSLPITKRIKIIVKKKFARTTLDENVEVFVIYDGFFNQG